MTERAEMKKIIVLLIAVILLAGCAEAEAENVASDVPHEEYEPAEIIETPEEPENEPEPEEENEPEPPEEDRRFAALALLGYHINDDGIIIVDYPLGVVREAFREHYFGEFDPETFRKYFFGTWNYWYVLQHTDGRMESIPLIMDDSIKSYSYPYLSGMVGKIGENTIVTDFINGGLHTILWMDINEPDILYSMQDLSYFEEGFIVGNTVHEWSPRIGIMVRADMPINEPQDGFLSHLRLLEIAEKHEINFEMLASFSKPYGQIVNVGGVYYQGELFLVSESIDKFVLRADIYEWSEFLYSAICTFERTNDEWKQTVEVDMEQLEEVINELRN